VSFPGTIADAAIYVLQKGKPTDYWEMNVCEWGKPSVTVSQAFYLKSADHVFVALGDKRLATIMEKVEKVRSLPLAKLLNSSVGFIAKQGKVTNKPISQKDMVVYKGENVTRYALKGHFYFNFAKSNLAGGTQDEAKLGIKEKILLRKTGDRIFATIDDTSNFPEQSLYFLYASGGLSNDKQHEADMEQWLTALKEGELSVKMICDSSPLLLKRKEELQVVLPNMALWEPRSVRQGAGGYGGPSFRIAKGVYWRLGAFKAQSESHEELRAIDQGRFTLTNKRLVFSGAKRTVDINLNKIEYIKSRSTG